MNRLFNPTVAALGLCIALAVSGCESAPASSPAAATDTTSDSSGAADVGTSDTGAGGSDATGSDGTTTGGDADVTTKADSTDTSPDTAADTATMPTKCDPSCKSGEYCDLFAKPPVCKAATCTFPTKWGKDVQKVSKLNLPPATVGCDLDADGKPNNALAAGLSALLKQANDSMSKAVADGTITLVVETDGFKSDGSEFPGSMLLGELDASNDKCDVMSDSANCKYSIDPTSYDPKAASGVCPALIAFPNMKVKAGALAAGGPKQTFSLTLPIQGVALQLKVNQATLQGKVTGTTTWDSTKEGLICGVIALDDIKNAIGNIEALKDFAPLVSSMLKPDMDVDGDGKKESVSVAIDFETVKGQITGLTK